MLNANPTTKRRPCACRGAGICPDCDRHTCAGGCTCNLDGAPQTTPTGYGHINPSQARQEAWAAKQEARR